MNSSNSEKGDGGTGKPDSGSDRFWRRYGSGAGSERAEPEPTPGREAEPGGDPWDEPSGDPWDEPVSEPSAGDDRPGDPRWAHPGNGHSASGHDHECLEWCPVCRGAEILRAAVPPELKEQFETVQRDMLLMAQAMIESHLARMREQHQAGRPGRDAGDPPVEDIPIQ